MMATLDLSYYSERYLLYDCCVWANNKHKPFLHVQIHIESSVTNINTNEYELKREKNKKATTQIAHFFCRLLYGFFNGIAKEKKLKEKMK